MWFFKAQYSYDETPSTKASRCLRWHHGAVARYHSDSSYLERHGYQWLGIFFFHWEQSKNPNVPELYGNKKEQEVKTCKNLGFHSGQIFPPIHWIFWLPWPCPAFNSILPGGQILAHILDWGVGAVLGRPNFRRTRVLQGSKFVFWKYAGDVNSLPSLPHPLAHWHARATALWLVDRQFSHLSVSLELTRFCCVTDIPKTF